MGPERSGPIKDEGVGIEDKADRDAELDQAACRGQHDWQ